MNLYYRIFCLSHLTCSTVFTGSEQKTFVSYLSITEADNNLTWDFFFSSRQQSGRLTKIQSPSCWEHHGFGTFNYEYDSLKERLNETGSGRTSCMVSSVQNLNIIVDMNMSAVRMTNEPLRKYFLNVCDSLGPLVLDEPAGWQYPPYDDTVGLKLLTGMITRDKDQQCIIFGDNGNEDGSNYHLDKEFVLLDIQQREVLHPCQKSGKFITLHYINYNYPTHDNQCRRKIFLSTEFMHRLYYCGADAGLEAYWGKMWDDPLCMGGFLWYYLDGDTEGTDHHARLDKDVNHALDGIIRPYPEKEGSYSVTNEIWASEIIEKRYASPEFNGRPNIENRFLYTNFSQCKFEESRKRFSQPGETSDIQNYNTRLIGIDFAPDQKKEFQLDLPHEWIQYDALSTTEYDSNGRQIYTWNFSVKTPTQYTYNTWKQHQCKQIELSQSEENFTVTTCSLTVVFDKKTRLYKNVAQNGIQIPVSNGPVILGTTGNFKKLLCKKKNDTVSLSELLDDNNQFERRISKGGLLYLNVKHKPVTHNFFSGLSPDFPEQPFSGLCWLGNDPYRIYENRMKGVTFGFWEKKYINTTTDEFEYNNPEFKKYFSKTYWAELSTKNNDNGFTIHVFSNDICLRLFTPKPPIMSANTTIEYPPGDISFLNSINAIGTKLPKPEGPQAALKEFNPVRIHDRLLTIKLVFDNRISSRFVSIK